MTVPAINLTPKGGAPNLYVPIDVVLVEEGGKKFWNIRANKARKETGVKIDDKETESTFYNRMKQEKGADVQIESEGDGKYTVIYLEPKTELLPYNPENKASLPGAFVDYVDNWYSKNVGSAAPAPKTKTTSEKKTGYDPKDPI